MRIGALALVLIVGCGDAATTSGAGGGGASSSTSDGGASSSTGTASASGGGVTGSGGAGGSGDGSKCGSSSFAICESFEDAPVDGFPTGWGPRGDEWGDGTIGVSDQDAKRGAKSLLVHGGATGQRFMDFKGDLGALASHHYGRVFLKVEIPAPWPTSGVLHGDFIEGLGPGPNGSTHNVRWGVVENTEQKFQWIYNVQPSNAPEFAEGTGYDYSWTGAWQCVEWMYDEPSQKGTLWIDGVELPLVPGTSHAAEIPVFSSLGVGFANYQDAGAGFVVRFDELAYDAERIGCEN
jgi:hypothetical protein